MRTINKIDDTFIQNIKEYYLNNDASLQWIAENSKELFGRDISLADLKVFSRSDPKGQWSVLKANKGRKTEDVPMSEKILAVANKLYEEMFKDDGDLSPSQLAQVAKTWSDLIDKAKLTKDISSSKMSSQSVKDIVSEELAKIVTN